ncbi:MAG: hypothetical protein FJX52_10190 [Alphaproteobacteria bacterium]|nr:hypothetical protein [Alphaproteobacteria bacterium]
MPDWLLVQLSVWQRAIIGGLADGLSGSGVAVAALAFALGAVHALTPGHGKMALATYFLGRAASIGTGARIALSAAALHVLSGCAMFLVLRFVVGQTSNITGRAAPPLATLGYVLIVAAGAIMLYRSLWPERRGAGEARALTAGIGLLPCPLTISVLGFSWAQRTAAMVGLIVIALALGVASTIALVAVAAILMRRLAGMAWLDQLPNLELRSRQGQGFAGVCIMAIGVYTIAALG